MSRETMYRQTAMLKTYCTNHIHCQRVAANETATTTMAACNNSDIKAINALCENSLISLRNILSSLGCRSIIFCEYYSTVM